jgi:hypothetical protein
MTVARRNQNAIRLGAQLNGATKSGIERARLVEYLEWVTTRKKPANTCPANP